MFQLAGEVVVTWHEKCRPSRCRPAGRPFAVGFVWADLPTPYLGIKALTSPTHYACIHKAHIANC